MTHRQRCRTTRTALSLTVALALASSGAAIAAPRGRSTGDTTFPFKYADCTGLWFKTHAPRDALQNAIPKRYEVYAGHTNGSPWDEEVTNRVYGNLYVQTDRCLDAEGRPATISRVSVQVRQPAFDPGQRAVAFPGADKPVGTFWEYYYLIAVVLPEREAATRKLGRYLADQGLPVHAGTVAETLTKMGAASTDYVAPTTNVKAGPLNYRVDGVASNAVKEGTHEHVSSYYYDVVGRDRRVRTTRMVIDSLTVDWLAACNVSSTGAPMTTLMGTSTNPSGWCFYMEGPHTWVTSAKLS